MKHEWERMETAPKNGTTILVVGGTYTYENDTNRYDAGRVPRLVVWMKDNWRAAIPKRIDFPAYWIYPLPSPPIFD